MLRSLLIYLSRAKWAQKIVMGWGLARRVVRRFVAGETEDEAVAAIRALNARGFTATVDVLGESVTDAAMARDAAGAYLHLIERIEQEGLQAWVSVKLTALGLDIDAALCRQHMRDILACARERDIRVTVDMEDRHYTQATLDMVRALRYEDGFENVRAVIQAYLYRTDEDIRTLAAEGFGVRLCKGAYKEPPDVAYPKKSDVDASMVRNMKVLLDAAKEGRGYPGIATHDARIIEIAKAYAAEHAIPRERFEFQMLHGVRTGLQEQLVAEGYGMRVYVPFGTQWYPYFMRRLAERPANVWFFVSSLFKR
ncbi:MAG: proline dehydrogenase [Anaerolineae bacterium]